MNHQDWSCIEHGQPIISFCISDHNCPDRRLCPKCLYTSHNNIDKLQIPLVDDFQKQLSEKLNGFSNGQHCDLLKLIKQFYDQINKIFQDLQASALFLLKSCEEIGNDIQEIKKKLQTNSFLNFSESDRNLMIGIVRDNLIQKKYDEQNQFRNEIQNIEEQFRTKFEVSIKSLKKLITPHREKMNDNLFSEGIKILGLRIGDYYYQYEDGTKELAGAYQFDLRNKKWKIYIGKKYKPCQISAGHKKYQMKRKIYLTQNYKDGFEVKNILQENYTSINERFQLDKNQLQKQYENMNVELYGQEYQIKFQGNLLDGQKIGQWQYVYDENIIGGGAFDNNVLKKGMWKECDQMYNNDCQVVYCGEYKNGLRFGQWTTLSKNFMMNQYYFYVSGGGNYEQGVKSGPWIDLHENFWDGCQVVYIGEYKNGLRFGQWTTLYKNKQIGGGNYDEKGVKSGNWTDLHENFYDFCQIVYCGEYKNGLRFGQWTIQSYENSEDQSGGGNYDEKGLKSGTWTEFHENFNDFCQVVYCGEYKNGLRQGEWNTLQKKDRMQSQTKKICTYKIEFNANKQKLFI